MHLISGRAGQACATRYQVGRCRREWPHRAHLSSKRVLDRWLAMLQRVQVHRMRRLGGPQIDLWRQRQLVRLRMVPVGYLLSGRAQHGVLLLLMLLLLNECLMMSMNIMLLLLLMVMRVMMVRVVGVARGVRGRVRVRM